MTIRYNNEGAVKLAPELRTLPEGSIVWPVYHETVVEVDGSTSHTLTYRGGNQILNRPVNIGAYRIAPLALVEEIGWREGSLNLHLFSDPVEIIDPMRIYDPRNFSVRTVLHVAGFIYNPLDLTPRKIK